MIESLNKLKCPWTNRFFLHAVLLLASMFSITAGCNGGSGGNGNSNKTNSGKSNQNAMVKSTGQFQKGFQDGKRAGEQAWGDMDMTRMWLWMADSQYQNGYDRGWQYGRQQAKLKENQKKQLGTREPLTPTPSLLKQQQQQQNERQSETHPATKTSSVKKGS